MARKWPELDVMKMYATLTLERWKFLLRLSVKENRVEKLLSWRYGLQSGLSAVNKRGNISDEKLDMWVIKRCRDLEKAMKIILRKKYPSPMDNPKHDPLAYIHKVKETKRRRDREFEEFLQKSNF